MTGYAIRTSTNLLIPGSFPLCALDMCMGLIKLSAVRLVLGPPISGTNSSFCRQIIETIPMSSSKIRVAILDDNAKFRKSLGNLLGNEPDICVVTESEAGPAGVKEVEEQKPDVILLADKQPFRKGLNATQMIVSSYPDTRVIVLSMHSKRNMAASSCQTWACYPVCEHCSTRKILAAIRGGPNPDLANSHEKN
jgi:CheY-like chemotaxis protein